jgi:RNA polymerase sigma factor (sigma-70 family)
VVAGHEAVQAVHVGLAGLPDDQREAIRLHYLDGASVKETAAAMERSPDAVRGLLHRAKQALRNTLGRSSRWLSKK